MMLIQRPVKTLLLAAISVLLASCTSPAPQTNGPMSIGIITRSMGFPTVVRKNQTYILAVQARIFEGDIVSTDENSKLNIKMSDGTVFSLGPNSHFVLHTYKYTPQTWAPVARMSFINGTLRTTTGVITKRRRTSFQIKTPLAIIDVASGDFWVGYLSENTLEVAMDQGTDIDIFNDNGSVGIHEPGYGTLVIGDSAPQTPKIWAGQRIKDAFSKLVF